MPNPNSLIDGIRSLSPSIEVLAARPLQAMQIVTVKFNGDRTGLLDIKNPRSAHWARILDRLGREKRQAYVEIDPETRIIINLLIPETSRVWSLTPDNAGDIEVKLIPSQSPHYLKRSNPDFEPMLNALHSAKDKDSEVLVTTSRDDHEIIDVRHLPKSQDTRNMDAPPPPPSDPPVSEQKAKDLFDLMNSKSCDPCTAPEPCIPFKYPDDGCYARAHEMCRLMIAEGEVPEKVWIYATSDNSLRPNTSNSPDCVVGWWYHVAPTLLVTTGGGTEKRVIDPSLSIGPISVDEWKKRQNDLTATLEYSDASIYFKGPGATTGMTDNNYTQTNSALQDKRDLLIDNCLKYGPPPYSCPITKDCFLIVDRNTFAKDEIDAMLHQASPAVIDAAFYIVVDGFKPEELGITTATLVDPPNVKPSVSITPTVSGMSVQVVHLGMEDPSHLKRRQRLTWTCKIIFTGISAFVNELEIVTLSASISTLSGSALIYLIKQLNPFEIDGQISWLSTDLRVFQIKSGAPKLFGVTIGNNPADAPSFIQQVITNLNTGNTDGQTFENNISTDQQISKLELSEKVNGTPVFNFAVARVRYRALTLPASNVRVFFRLFPASSTSLEYNQSTTYRRGGQAGATIPLLGIQGGEVVTIPCFAAPRIDTSTMNMNAQTDPANVQTLPPDSNGAEVVKYFGCWLDINQVQPQFPLQPFPADGPFPQAGRKTIQELVRDKHQCLVSEIAFDPAPILPGAAPASSDKLAQRNLAIIESANPGIFASHRIPHTFEIQPTKSELEHGELPDELMIDWGNTPPGSLATFYLPGMSTNTVLRMAVKMYRSDRFVYINDHTLQCQTGGFTYIPIPPGDGVNFAGMITVDLPETVKKGQVFKIVVRQVTSVVKDGPVEPRSREKLVNRGNWRRIIGSFQITIPVSTKDVMLEPEERLLSNLRWIQRAIPQDNRWFLVFGRYVGQIASRVDALGGDSSKVMPSPSGEWRDTKRCRVLSMVNAGLVGALIVMLGTLSGSTGLAVVVFIAAAAYAWMKQCQPGLCSLLRTFVTGAGIGAFILIALAFSGFYSTQLAAVLAVTIVLAVLAGVIGAIRKCF